MEHSSHLEGARLLKWCAEMIVAYMECSSPFVVQCFYTGVRKILNYLGFIASRWVQYIVISPNILVFAYFYTKR